MSDQQEQLSSDGGEEGEVGQAHTDPPASRPPPSVPVDLEDCVIVEIDRPGDALVKGVLEYEQELNIPDDPPGAYDYEWCEHESPSPYGIFGPLIIICRD